MLGDYTRQVRPLRILNNSVMIMSLSMHFSAF